MVRTSALAATVAALTAVPLQGQETPFTWMDDRPDAVAPAGVAGDRVVARGDLEVSYTFQKTDLETLLFGSDLIVDPGLLFDLFTVVPLSLSSDTHTLSAAFGVRDDLTLIASTGFVMNTREQITETQYFITGSESLTDSRVDAVWQFYDQGSYRAQLLLGAIVPTGSVSERADVLGRDDAILPYDMQIGSGSFAVAPGAGFQSMNESGVVGAQVRAVLRVNENSRNYKIGDALDATAWAQYRFNDWIAATARVRTFVQGAISGDGDPELETLRDPGELGLSFGRTRVDIPVGLNLYMPDGKLLGHRLGVEGVWTVHEEVDGILLGSDFGFQISWRKDFQLF